MGTQVDIRKEKLTKRLEQIHDRIMELHGERTKLQHEFEHGRIDTLLAYMKEDVINFEVTLLSDELEEIQSECYLIELAEHFKLDFQE